MITPIELDLLGRAEQMAEQLAGNLPVHVATCSYLARLYVLETVDLRLVCFYLWIMCLSGSMAMV